MAEKRKKLPIYISPLGIASYPWLTKPDTKWSPEGEYRISLVLDEAVAQDFTARLDALLDAAYDLMVAENPKVRGIKKAASRVKQLLDENKDPIDGKVKVDFKMKAKLTSKKTGESWEQRPAIFDGVGKALVAPKVGAGSEVKIAFEAAPYYSAKDREAGITLRLKAVQILKLVEFGQRDAASYGFDVSDAPEGADADTTPTDEEAEF